MDTINKKFSKPITEVIKMRFSCRTYTGEPIEPDIKSKLSDFIKTLPKGPFGSQPRFDLVVSTEQDSNELIGLGTYGFIKNAPGFIIGATTESSKKLEDFGYLMETIILYATDLGFGTCWLGGTFTRSSFAERINAREQEVIPAVTAVGYPAGNARKLDARIRKAANSDHRLPWNELFFDKNFNNSLLPDQAYDYIHPLEMIRIGPSASNKQPWRILRWENCWHFYLKRTPGYRENRLLSIMKIEDLQRVDMGIAMAHFELTANALHLAGFWQIQDQQPVDSMEECEYLVSWIVE